MFGKRCYKFGVVYGWSDSLILGKLSVLGKSLWNESVGVATLAHKLGLGRHVAYQGSHSHSAGFGSFPFDLNSHTHVQISIELKGITGAYLWWEESCYERNMLIAKLSWIEDRSVCYNEKQENLRAKHTNCSIFQHPICIAVVTPKNAPDWKCKWIF